MLLDKVRPLAVEDVGLPVHVDKLFTVDHQTASRKVSQRDQERKALVSVDVFFYLRVLE